MVLMARYPGAVWRPVGNFGYPRSSHGQLRPVAIVDHIAEGTMAGMDAWFNNPTSEASAHFAVGKRGQVHQYVDLEDAAWANGKKDRPDNTIPWMAAENPNLVTVSIEHEGYTGEAWTEAMYAADLALHRWLVGTFGIPVDDNHIVGHYRIDSVNRARCPGTGWPKARLFQDLEEDDDMCKTQAEFNERAIEFAKTVGIPRESRNPTAFHDWATLTRVLEALWGHIHDAAKHGGGGGLTVEQVKAIIKATKLSP